MRKNKKRCCPNCFKDTIWEEIITNTEIEVKGESFSVKVRNYKCCECKEIFRSMFDSIDPVDGAFRKYRKKHGLLQPEEIKALRKKYNLTQKELSSLLGFGEVTISRYENGALQDLTHDNLLQLVKEPRSLLFLIRKNFDVIPDVDRRNNLIESLENEIRNQESEIAYSKRNRNNQHQPNLSSYGHLDKYENCVAA